MMDQPTLPMVLLDPTPSVDRVRTRPEQARVLRPVRNQVEMMLRDLDSLVADDHPTRAVWAILQRLDLADFYARIKATTARPGHPAIDPAILLAVWVYATSDGIASARRINELCGEHDAYRWLCGGVSVNYHTIADFRTAYPEELDRLLTQILGTLLAAEQITLQHVAQDGIRVRASAGSGSFHRRAHLTACLAAARAQVERLTQERQHPDPHASVRQQQARERAARERTERLDEALKQMPALQAAKTRQHRTLAKPKREKIREPRVSTTDPDARVMKMPDGGFRPAFNVELATDVASGMIVGVTVINQGSDANQATPMDAQIVERTGLHPRSMLVDGGFAQREEITLLTQRGVDVYAPTRPPRTTTSGRTKDMARDDDSPEVKAWRSKMETVEAKTRYRQRAATAEWTNAQLRHHALTQFSVRGLTNVLSVALLMAVTHNVLRWIAFTA
jgi:transposase